ncbi:MAG TPA: pseudouridine synthase [Burkholderiaceae bacterium]|nr:pseudouridine synthase [Burkholderiaceae bacterium]
MPLPAPPAPVPASAPVPAPAPTAAGLTLLHVDRELVAIDKPAGLLVHPSALDAHETVTALDLLAERLGARPWPLHRLDKGTSGVLLFARDAAAAGRWRRAFEEGRVRKRYVALVRGWPAASGEIDAPLARDPERPSAGQPLLPALTRWRRLARHEWPFAVDGRHPTSRYALVEVEPVTGRRHQIRRHFKRLAHPLVGDATHGKGAHNRAAAAWLGVSRLWLHAESLSIDGGPDGAGALRIDAPRGAEWARLGEPVGEDGAAGA